MNRIHNSRSLDNVQQNPIVIRHDVWTDQILMTHYKVERFNFTQKQLKVSVTYATWFVWLKILIVMLSHRYPPVTLTSHRVVTKSSSCRINTTCRQGIKQQQVSFGSIFLLFPLKVAGAHVHSSQGKSPASASWWQHCS